MLLGLLELERDGMVVHDGSENNGKSVVSNICL